MNQLETLLHRYKEGVITPEEKAELDQLTHKQEVFSAASEQASAMRRRQHAIISSVASVLIVVGVVFTIWSPKGGGMSDSPLVAQSREVQSPAVVGITAQQTKSLPTEASPLPTDQPLADETAVVQEYESVIAQPMEVAPATREPVSSVPVPAEIVEPVALIASEPVVACNTQCSPDSVINDIWNFLKA